MLTEMILTTDVDLTMPISKVDENIEKGHSVNSVMTEKFWWPLPEVKECTMAEIITDLLSKCEPLIAPNPSYKKAADHFTGLSNGTFKTGATRLRELIHASPEYLQDSVISEKLSYQIMNYLCIDEH
jgi:hypothetical protein